MKATIYKNEETEMKRYWVVIITVLLFVVSAVLPASAQGNTCGSAASPRLTIGGMGRVTPGLPNVIRSLPGKGTVSKILGEIPANAVFTMLGNSGPQCANGMWWWLVSYNNITGWTPEGNEWGTYWTEPYFNQPACSAAAPRLTIGGQGRVLPGLPNVIRNNPWKGGDSKVLAQIPAGGVFAVLDGPHCSNNIYWWWVNYNGVIGWTGESELTTYWLEPVSTTGGCPANLPTRLWAGGWGRVLPGLANNLRSGATISSRSVGKIPGDGIFSVITGPVCADGIAWWQVNYNNVIGWTAEGRWGQYWLEPRT
jgi:hypothetical protein